MGGAAAWTILKAMATAVLATFGMAAGGRTDVDLNEHLDAIRPPHGPMALGRWLARTYVSAVVEARLAEYVTSVITRAFHTDTASREIPALIGSMAAARICHLVQAVADRAGHPGRAHRSTIDQSDDVEYVHRPPQTA